jgi:hypothetical protein
MRIHGLVPAASRVLKATSKSVVVVGLAAAMTLPAVPAAQAFNAAAVAHFGSCLSLLFSNPEAHAESCLPSNVAPSFGPIAGGAAGPGLEACSDLSWYEKKKTTCIKDNWDIKFPKWRGRSKDKSSS